MRDIKFRVWDKNYNRMDEIDGSCLYLADSKIYEVEELSSNYQCYMNKKDVTNEYELMQYTGLYDNEDYDELNYREQQEVYEDDIVRFKYNEEEHTGIIKFEVGMFIIVCNDLIDGYVALFDICENDGDYHWINGQVIGNKYMNKELLEGGLNV